MIDKLKKTMYETVRTNIKGYILIVGVFLAGVILSTVLNISAGREEEIKLYINDFVSNVKNYSTDSLKTFGIAMSGYIKFVTIMFLLSITVIGSVGTLAYVFIKGFSYGAVFVCLFNMIGTKALLFFVCAVLPHILVTVPCCVSYSFFCTKNSYIISKGVKDLKASILAPLLYGMLCILLVSVGALIQAYVEPVFIRLINLN